jgi:hypothetical protein
MKWAAIILSGLSALVWLWSALIRIPGVYNLVGSYLMPHSDEPQKELAFSSANQTAREAERGRRWIDVPGHHCAGTELTRRQSAERHRS